MATIRTEYLAFRANDDVNRVAQRAVLEARRVSLYVKNRAMLALRGKQRFEVRDKILRLAPFMADTMLASHAVGWRRSELMRPAAMATVPSSEVFTSAVDFLKKKASGRFKTLKDQYDIRAMNVLSKAADHVENSLSEAVADMTAEGVHLRDGMDLLNQRFESLGLGTQRSYLLETLFRTQTQLAYGAGRWDADQDPAVQEILWGYEYTAVMDDRTRETHAALDGTTLPKDDPFWSRHWPPNGWNCRCAAIPVYETVSEVRPPAQTGDGSSVGPDEGFAFNAGQVYGVAKG